MSGFSLLINCVHAFNKSFSVLKLLISELSIASQDPTTKQLFKYGLSEP